MLKHRGAKIDTKHIVQLTQSENEYQTSGRVITGSQQSKRQKIIKIKSSQKRRGYEIE